MSLAAAAPAFAASPCARVVPHSGSMLTLNYDSSNSSGGDVDQNLTVAFSDDFRVPAATFSGDAEGMTAIVSSFQGAYTFPFAVVWDDTDPNWDISLTGQDASGFTYTLTPAPGVLPAALVVRLPLGNETPAPITESNSLPFPNMAGTAVVAGGEGDSFSVPFSHLFSYSVVLPDGSTISDDYVYANTHTFTRSSTARVAAPQTLVSSVASITS